MRVKITQKCDGPPIGSEIEGPYSFRLVELGLAEPVDDEAYAKQVEHEAYLEKVRRNIQAQAEKALEVAKAAADVAEKERLKQFQVFLVEGNNDESEGNDS